jgi:pimeloyl-ACP methyl ester carboxylesterase
MGRRLGGGVLLHYTVEGRGPARILLVHGFTQTTTTWDDVARQLVDEVEVVRVDLPGHGGSADARLSFEETAAALGEVGGRATYVGYSMGGRLCLRLALERADLVNALVLLGASPGVADPAERAERRHSEKLLAADILESGDGGLPPRRPRPACLRDGPAPPHRPGGAPHQPGRRAGRRPRRPGDRRPDAPLGPAALSTSGPSLRFSL